MLFVDIVGSTALGERLDPEALRDIIDRYFAGCSEAVAAHGGLVEKFIGDAVLAVFGADVSHEDDALRAVRAAAGALSALDELNVELLGSHHEQLAARCGISSGEVMVLTRGEDFRVVGDAVNIASRLQTAAKPGEILIDTSTRNMVRASFRLEPVAPLVLKGKADRLPAWQVGLPELSVTAVTSRRASPFIGRADELYELRQAYRRVTERRRPCLFTILGSPGLGKSRLLREFITGLAGPAVEPGEHSPRADPGPGAVVLAGRCSSYGRGITYKPLTEALESYPGGWTALSRLLSDDADRGQPSVSRLRTVLGAGGDGRDEEAGSGRTGIEEISWAVQCVCEVLGEARPLVLVFEDLHWAEETLLDLIDDVATWLSDVAVLLVCTARPELLDARPTWGGGKSSAVTLDLPPLTAAQCAELVSELALHADVYPQGEDVYADVAVECDGNPLFAELMLDVLTGLESQPAAWTGAESPATPLDAGGLGPGASSMPPTIHALLAARLDQLPERERTLLQQAAVIGREFSLDMLAALAEAHGTTVSAIRELTSRLLRRRVIQRGDGAGSYRFVQAMFRDTAYGSTPKSRRVQWHQLLARWCADLLGSQGPGARGTAMELARHVEAASQLQRELSPGDTALPDLSDVAADILVAEGTTALRRKDLPAAATLLERGRQLLHPADARRLPLTLRISDAWLSMWDEGKALAAVQSASAAAAPEAQLAYEVQSLIVALRMGRRLPAQVAAEATMLEARMLAEARDDLSWCRYFQLRAYLQFAAEHAGNAEQLFRLALERARALRDMYEEEKLMCALCELGQWTPTHVAAGLATCDELVGRFAGSRSLLVPVLVTRARLSALAGELEAAGEDVSTALHHARDLHLDVARAAALEVRGCAAALAGHHGVAESSYRQAEAILRAGHQLRAADTLVVEQARAQFDQGRTADAVATLDKINGAEPGLDLRTRVMATALRGRLALSAGPPADPVALARKAVRLADLTQDLCLQSDALFDLAVVLAATGAPGEASAAATAALARSQEKGAAIAARRISGWLAIHEQ